MFTVVITQSRRVQPQLVAAALLALLHISLVGPEFAFANGTLSILSASGQCRLGAHVGAL